MSSSAQAIIYEMNARLDMKQGGEMAENFRRLYNYFYRRLQEANLKKKKSPIEEVIGHLRDCATVGRKCCDMARETDGELKDVQFG